VSFFIFYHWAGCLEQLDHSQNSLLSSLSGRLPGTIRPLASFLAFSSGRSPGTIRPLASFLAFYHRGGRLENRTNVEIIFMYFTRLMLKSLSCISQNHCWNHFHVFHKTVAEIIFMYFTRLMLKSLSCISQNHRRNHFHVFHKINIENTFMFFTWAGRP
jgi:hypothetical protein